MKNIVYYATYEKHVDYFMRRMVEKLSDIGIKYKFRRDREIIQTEKFVIFGISVFGNKTWLPQIDYFALEDDYNKFLFSNCLLDISFVAFNYNLIMTKCKENYKEITEADLYGLIEELNQYQ